MWILGLFSALTAWGCLMFIEARHSGRLYSWSAAFKPLDGSDRRLLYLAAAFAVVAVISFFLVLSSS